MVNYGRDQRSDLISFYTFVIVDGLLRFSPTGDDHLKDIASKHTVHANCARSVTFSGEFHVEPDGNTYTAVFHNSSGTYRPDKEYLPKLEELLQRNFHGMGIKVFNFDDPELERRIENVKQCNKELKKHKKN